MRLHSACAHLKEAGVQYEIIEGLTEEQILSLFDMPDDLEAACRRCYCVYYHFGDYTRATSICHTSCCPTGVYYRDGEQWIRYGSYGSSAYLETCMCR